ncbi:MAG: hypothetical protein ACYCY6_01660 [Minisyncoccota bacterium]
MRQYIGITGFMNLEELERVSNSYLGGSTDPFIMVGILVSHKTFHGLLNKWPNRYPRPVAIDKMLEKVSDARLHTYIHYATDARHEDMSIELTDLAEAFGQASGIQLNIPWPSVRTLRKFKESPASKHHKIILQVGPRALNMIDGRAERLVLMLRSYTHFDAIDYILLDPSGGHGEDMNLKSTRGYMRAIHDAGLHEKFGIGICGGLSDQNIDHITTLLEEFPNTSIDAEGRLRDEDDHLDVSRAIRYADSALTIMREAKEKLRKKEEVT